MATCWLAVLSILGTTQRQKRGTYGQLRRITVDIQVTSCMALNGIDLSLSDTDFQAFYEEPYFHMTILCTQHPTQNR